MEEIYIWIFIAGAFILSGLSRANKSKRKAEDDSDGQEGSERQRSARELLEEWLGKEATREAWPKMESTPAPELAPKPSPRNATTSAPQPSVRPAAMHATTAQSSLKHTTPAAKPLPPINTAATTEGGQTDAQEIRENFDLRRAVIYSEILHPKFDEQD